MVPLSPCGLALSSPPAETSPPHQALTPRPRPPFPGLLLHDVTMAGLQELRFPEEKPLLRGQDAAELVSSRPFSVLGWRAPPRGYEGNCASFLWSD